MQIPAAGARPYSPPAAQAGQAAQAAMSPTKAASDPVADFLDFVGKTPAEQMRAEILHELGLSEDDLKAMDPKERLKVEAKIKELVREKVQESVEKKTGVAVDIKV
jgi:hypothetical protein